MHDFDMEAIVKSLILNNDEKQGIRQQSIKLSSKFGSSVFMENNILNNNSFFIFVKYICLFLKLK
jgi:hypothetical protein